MNKNEDNWLSNYEELKAHVLDTGHFCDKHTRLCNWAKYQRKRIKAGTMPDEQRVMFDALLIDERNQCPKDAELGYIPQTVLNIIGYFKQRDLVSGTRMVLAQSVYKDADSNMARNIERAVSSNVFPEGTMDLLDYYIDKLIEGEF